MAIIMNINFRDILYSFQFIDDLITFDRLKFVLRKINLQFRNFLLTFQLRSVVKNVYIIIL